LKNFSPFSAFFTSDVAYFGCKNLAAPIYHGKNFGGVFFNMFCKLEQESEKISTVDTLVAKIPN